MRKHRYNNNLCLCFKGHFPDGPWLADIPECLSVPMILKSRMEGHSELIIGRKESNDTNDPWPHLEVERSKVKVTRPLNAVTENQPYLWYEKAYTNFKLATGMASPTCAVTSNLKAMGGCSSHHLQGAGAYCGGCTTDRTACNNDKLGDAAVKYFLGCYLNILKKTVND